MMRRILSVSTVVVLSSLGMINEVHAGLLNQPQPAASLPKHNLTLSQADIPASPILANTINKANDTNLPPNPIYAKSVEDPASAETPPLPAFAKSPDASTSSDTTPLPTFAKSPDAPVASDIQPNTTLTNSPENHPSLPKPSEEVSSTTVQKNIDPPPAAELKTESPVLKANQIKILPQPSIATPKSKKAKRLPAPSQIHLKHQHHHHHHTHITVPENNKPYISFKGIAADGNIHVIVEPGNTRSVEVLSNNYPASKLVFADVSRGVLILHDVSRENLDEQAPKFIKVKVVTPTLGSIQLRDHSSLSAKNLAYNIMDIDAATTGFLKIRGNVCLHHIHQQGRGPINIEWTNSDHIKIISTGPGLIHLAGTTDILNVRARDHANIDAKFLRANSGLIQADENATVAVTVIDALSGFATGISNIFYYKTPKHLTRHTYDLANVIQMNYWN